MLRPARLKHFFCYNPTYGPKEGQEHMKVLYYYPEDLELDTKVKAVGLSEGFVNFTRCAAVLRCREEKGENMRFCVQL